MNKNINEVNHYANYRLQNYIKNIEHKLRTFEKNVILFINLSKLL